MTEIQRYTALVRTLIFVFRDDELLMMKYSGKGGNQTEEKADRKDIYNPIGGHVEEGEDIIQNALKEAKEEAGIRLVKPKIKGVINIHGFAGKNMINFIITGKTNDEIVHSSIEGELHWIKLRDIAQLNTFADIQPILDTLMKLKPDQIFTGVAEFRKFELLDLRLQIN